MNTINNQRKEHWDKIYSTKNPNEVSWTQESPTTSLDFIHSFHLNKEASIIDIGAGESKLVDRLLDEGFTDITVLDISETAIQKTKQRLGDKANKINWVVSDVTEFQTNKKFDVWHDRATFHFLTTTEQVNKYLTRAIESVKDKGFLTIGTFSENGPTKCSGLDIKQYSESTLQQQLRRGFEKIKCVLEDHLTPFNTLQNFLFCSFRRTILE
ncbi:MAG TPA: SAM-dependent methyltransferase [Cytophagales bacterium]|jgi:2-polyprenyl-3-methyl-5-hydroxy-6-metoxy-1,4-benzoquinol methylase|nr:SAM-dependent methyltransferase [Cytophagales bacterium]